MNQLEELLWGPLPKQKKIVDGRPLPYRAAEIYEVARAMKLSHPLGRALYAVNRLHNGWPRVGLDMMGVEQFLRRTRPSTAIRWRNHWKNGGKIKKL